MTNWIDNLTGETRAKLLRLVRRSSQTITALADALGLTDNAVRTHIAALERDGIIEQVGSQRDTGGKPARLYALTGDGEELFPKAYALVLGSLVEEIAVAEGHERAMELLSAVGRRVASGVPDSANVDARVGAAAAVLRSLGGDVDIEKTDSGWRLRGYACPLSSVTAKHPEVCALARTLVEEITGRPATECCERGERPRCCFVIAAEQAHQD
ncbi:MAG: helix-turn-helix domain-containing protein [Gemmatimonadales bacterium]